MEKRIAKADSTFLGFEDHGVLTAFVSFDYGNGGHQSIPPRCFGSRAETNPPTGAFGQFVMAVLDAFGVDQWERIKGRTIYAVLDRPKSLGYETIVGLEPLPTERGKACNFEEMFAEGK